MALDPNLFSIEDIYPNFDQGQDSLGVRADYDLRDRLTEGYRSLDVWSDLFAALSKVMWTYFENQRRAVLDARDPGVLTRPYLPMRLRMLGLDYKSDVLTDEDYIRIASFYALYAKTTKHRDAFIRFMGFMKGLDMEMFRLWSTDYNAFYVGHGKTVFEGGDWFPTTHVGLAVSNPNEVDRPSDDELTELFYTLAPVNLVLKWIGDLIRVRLEDLRMGVHSALNDAMLRANMDWTYELTYQLKLFGIEYGSWWGVFPPWQDETAATVGAGSTTFQSVRCVATPRGIDWTKDHSAFPLLTTFSRDSRACYEDEDGYLVWVENGVPRIKACAMGVRQGWLFEPERYGYLHSVFDLMIEPWVTCNLQYDTSVTTESPDRSLAGAYRPDPEATDPDTVVVTQKVNFLDSDFNEWVVTVVAMATDRIRLVIDWYADTPDTVLETVTVDWTGATVSAGALDWVLNSPMVPDGWRKLQVRVTRPNGSKLAVFRIYPCETLTSTAYIYYVGMENGAYPTTLLYGGPCELAYRAPETLDFGEIAGQTLRGINGTVLFHAVFPGDFEQQTVFRAGQENGQYAKIVYNGSTSTLTLKTDSEWSNTQTVYDGSFPWVPLAPSADVKIGWSWDRVAGTVTYTHNGQSNTVTMAAPSIDNSGYLGAVPPINPDFWGYLTRLTVVPVALSDSDMTALLAAS